MHSKFVDIPHKQQERLRADYTTGNKAFIKAQAAQNWYMRLRYAIRTGDKHAARKLEIYKRIFSESINFIRALEGMARDYVEEQL